MSIETSAEYEREKNFFSVEVKLLNIITEMAREYVCIKKTKRRKYYRHKNIWKGSS